MAMPISNTHLRVPRGFGALLEGLTREILRDQPKDIPKYAAQYFEALLKQREESGVDPTEWAAKQEDRYYNNHSFKTHDLPSKISVSNENLQAEDYSALSEEDVSVATTKTKASDEADLTTEEAEPLITTQEEESDNEPPVENVDSTHSEAHSSPNEINDTIGSNQHISNSEAELHDLQLLSEAATKDVSAQELSETEKDNQQLIDQEEDVLKDVDVCATEIEEKTADEVLFMDKDYANAEQDIAHNESRPESLISQTTENTTPEEETKSETNEVVDSIEDVVESNIESNLEKSLVEVSFEDIPEKSMNYENEQPFDIGSKPSGEEEELEVENQEETNEDEEANNANDCEDIDRNESANNITAETLADENTNIKGEEDKSCQEEDFETDGDNDFGENTNLTEEDIIKILTETELQIKQHEKDNENEEKTLESGAHSEILDPNTSDLAEDDGEEQQPENTLEKYITTPHELHSEEEELMEGPKLDSEDLQGQSTCEQDSINPEERADPETTDLQEEQEEAISQRSTPKPDEETSSSKQEECSRPQEEEDIMDIPLDDPEANRAAAKIQAGFRGHMTRKKMKPEDKTEGEEVSSTGDVLNSSQGGTETGGSGPVGRDDTSVPEQ